MGDDRFVYCGEPFTAVVEDKGVEPILCTPAIYYDWQDQIVPSSGIAVKYPDGTASLWALLRDCNYIDIWHAVEVLRRHSSIANDTLCKCHYTGKRDDNPKDWERYIADTIDNIGRLAYDEIMAMPVPKQVVELVLHDLRELPRKEHRHHHRSIANEVRAGTLEWREEFTAAGVKHPNDIDAANWAEAKQMYKGYLWRWRRQHHRKQSAEWHAS